MMAHSHITTAPKIENASYNVTAEVSFRIPERNDDFTFVISSEPVSLSLYGKTINYVKLLLLLK